MAASDARLPPPELDRRTGAAVALTALALSGSATVLAGVLAAAGRHLALLVPGLAALGLGGGSLAVLLAPRLFPPGRVRERLAQAALAGAAALLGGLAATAAGGAPPAWAIAAAVVLPCVAGGVVAALALGASLWGIPPVCASGLGGAAGGVLAAAAAATAAGPAALLGLFAAVAALAAALVAPRGTAALRVAAALAAALGLGFAASPPELAGWSAGARLATGTLRADRARDALGVSGLFAGKVPEALALTVDGAPRAPLVRHGEGEDLAWGRWSLGALPHLLRPGGATLLLSAGGGRDILVALAAGASSVRAVEGEAAVVGLVQETLASFSGRPYSLDGVEAAVADGRAWLARDGAHYDVIRVALAGAPPGGGGGFAEERLATVEALHGMLSRLGAAGILGLEVAAADPAFPRVLAGARRALEEGGAADASRHLFAAARGPLATVLVCRRAFAAEEALALEQVGAALGYEVLVSPRGERGGPVHGPRGSPVRGDPAADPGYGALPATDDRPYPRSGLRPEDLLRPGPARLAGDRGALGLRSILLGLAGLLLLLLLLPLRRGFGTLPGIPGPPRDRAPPRIAPPTGAAPLLAAGVFFAALGLGLSLFAVLLAKGLAALSAGAPSAGAIVAAGLLGGAAAGSRRARGSLGRRGAVRTRCGALAIVLLLVAVSLPALVEIALPWPAAARVLGGAALAAAVGRLAGQPLPLGTVLAAARAARLAPWACCLVGLSGAIGAWLGPLLAVGLGHTSALMVGPACCLVAGAVGELL